MMEMNMKQLEFEKNELKETLNQLKKDFSRRLDVLQNENWDLQQKIQEYKIKFGCLFLKYEYN